MPETKMLRIGDDDSLVLPQEILDRLGVKVGDEILFIETPTGYRIARADGVTPKRGSEP